MKQIDPLIKMTADLLQHSYYEVDEVIDHMFEQLRKNLRNPTKPLIRLDELGRFELKPNIIRRWLYRTLPKLKKDRDNKELKEEFRYWWKMRQEALKYHLNKKRK